MQGADGDGRYAVPSGQTELRPTSGNGANYRLSGGGSLLLAD
jgi:hypothetical protein